MPYFQTKNYNWGKFWRDLQWKILVNFMVICFYCHFCGHSVYLWLFGIFFPFWYVVPKKSGNPAQRWIRDLHVELVEDVLLLPDVLVEVEVNDSGKLLQGLDIHNLLQEATLVNQVGQLPR
jgi:hypothetical protein